MIYKTKVIKEPVEIAESELGKNLSSIVKDFKSGKIDGIPTLFFLVREEDTHATFYSVNFNAEKYDDDINQNYFDIFLGCYVLDYTSPEHRLIEMEDDHEANYSFCEELYLALENTPCYTLDSLMENELIYFYSNGFKAADFSNYQEDLVMI